MEDLVNKVREIMIEKLIASKGRHDFDRTERVYNLAVYYNNYLMYFNI